MTIDVKTMATTYLAPDDPCVDAVGGLGVNLRPVDNPFSIWPRLEDITQRLSRV